MGAVAKHQFPTVPRHTIKPGTPEHGTPAERRNNAGTPEQGTMERGKPAEQPEHNGTTAEYRNNG